MKKKTLIDVLDVGRGIVQLTTFKLLLIYLGLFDQKSNVNV